MMMIKKIIYTIFCLIILTGCVAYKPVEKKNTKILSKGLKAKDFKAILNHIKKTEIQDSTLVFNSRLQYIKNGKHLPKISLQTRFRNHQAIWADGSLIFPIGRVLITPDGAKGYAKFPKKLYFDSDYAFLEKKVQLQNLSFEQIEFLLTGRPLFKPNLKDYNLKIIPEGYLLSYKKNEELLKSQSAEELTRMIEFNREFLVTKQQFTKPDSQTKVEISYSNFELINGQSFPKNMKIKVSGKENIELIMEHRSIQLNTAIQMPFRLPETGYKKINF